MKAAEFIVVGAGVVGSATAYGLAKKGHSVLVIEGERGAFNASRANFGLIWVQSKGDGFSAYQSITQQSARKWSDLAEELRGITSLPLTVEQMGGVVFCLGEHELETLSAKIRRLAAQQPGRKPDAVMVTRSELSRLLPDVELGPEVTGASFGRSEGHSNPLELLTCLHRAIARLGGRMRFQSPVLNIRPTGMGFEVETPGETFAAGRLVLAAGLFTTTLAQPLGVEIPLAPQRGQILVTERIRPFMPLPASGLRQTAEGTVMIGTTREDVGLNTDTTAQAASKLAARATRIIPALGDVTIVRQWSGLRVLTPDGAPIYAQSAQYPGVYTASCHSGVTLAAFHADALADAISDNSFAQKLSVFAPERFNVQKSA